MISFVVKRFFGSGSSIFRITGRHILGERVLTVAGQDVVLLSDLLVHACAYDAYRGSDI